MFTKPYYQDRELVQVCESIFATGAYVPRTVDEAELLRSLGYELHQGSLVLPEGIEYLDQVNIEKGLSDCGALYQKHVHIRNCVGSTNQELLSLVQRSEIFDTVLLAELQIAGRGRFGRIWQSPVGRNLAMSMGTRVTRTPTNLGAISLIVGVATANAIKEVGIEQVTLKWPNDVLIEGHKVGGILVDIVHASNPLELVIGIGLNVGGGSFVREVIGHPVADLLDYCSSPVRNKLAVSTVRNVFEALCNFERYGFQSFHESWNKLDALEGEPVKISTLQDSIQGVARGVRDTGELCIELENGRIHHVIAGDISLV